MSSDPCGCAEWEHELFNGDCPPPPLPNPCCGIAPADREPTLWCENGQCIGWYCHGCGVFTGTSAGPIRCGCMYDTENYHLAYAERPMLPISRSKKHERRYGRRKAYRHRTAPQIPPERL